MTRPLPTASSLDRALACPGSNFLPEGVPEIIEEGGYASIGTVFHTFVETARRDGLAAALAEAPEDEREWLETVDLAAIPAALESEVAMGWSVDSGAGVRYKLDKRRDYPKDGFIHMTLDLLGATKQRVIVMDLKRFGPKVPAQESAQLAANALAACAYAGADEAEVHMLQPTNSGWRVSSAVLDCFDLARWADRFRALAALVRSGNSDAPLVVSSNCEYCRLIRTCSAQTAVVRHFSEMDIATLDRRIAAMPVEEAGILWERIGIVEKIIELAKAPLKIRAKQETLPLPSGKVLKALPWTVTLTSDVAKKEMAALKSDLESRGEIRKGKGEQVRAVLPKE